LSTQELKPKDHPASESGLREPGTFLTAAGLLAATLFVWAQFWAQIQDGDPNRSIVLVWLYMTVIIDFAAIGLSGYTTLVKHTHEVSAISVGLFMAAFELTVLMILQSLASNLLSYCAETSPVLPGTCDRLHVWKYAASAAERPFVLRAILYTTGAIVTTVLGMQSMLGERHQSCVMWGGCQLHCCWHILM